MKLFSVPVVFVFASAISLAAAMGRGHKEPRYEPEPEYKKPHYEPEPEYKEPHYEPEPVRVCSIRVLAFLPVLCFNHDGADLQIAVIFLRHVVLLTFPTPKFSLNHEFSIPLGMLLSTHHG